jgi:hypothetical protein
VSVHHLSEISRQCDNMVRCKNAGGAPSDGDDSPPRLSEIARGKRIKIMARKKKKTLTDAEIA